MNNAGTVVMSTLDDTTPEMMDSMFHQHVKAPLQLIQLLKDKLIQQKGKYSIENYQISLCINHQKIVSLCEFCNRLDIEVKRVLII